MVIQVPVQGYFPENTYFYIDEVTKEGFLIDPGAEPERLLAMIEENVWSIVAILLTHGHFDHFGAVNMIRQILSIPVYSFDRSGQYLLDGQMNLSSYCGHEMTIADTQSLCDGDVLRLPHSISKTLQVIYTPGHTPDSVVFYNAADQVAFVGDTIFKGSVGTTEYPGGNTHKLQESVLHKIFTLPPETQLYSGHTDVTTVGVEKARYGL